MRVLIVNESAFEVKNSGYYTLDSWHIFASKLADYLNGATLLAPLREVPDGYPVKGDFFEPGQLKIVGLHYYNSFREYYLTYLPNYQKLNRQLEVLVRLHDISLITIPSPVISLIVKHSRRFNRPFVLILRGNIATASNLFFNSHGIKRTIRRLVLKIFINREHRCARNASLVYTYGEELAARFRKFCPNVKLLRTAHISLKDIFIREDTCTGNKIQISCVCRLIPTKGLEYLFKAMSLLRYRNLPVYLKIVGKEEDLRYGAHLRKTVQELGIKDYVEFAGWIPHSKILQIYRKSDIHVISSISEGIPRVILEGAASSLPLVTTSAGGCSSAVKDGEEAIVVPPADPAALADGIERVIRDGVLRRRLIQGGLEMARRYCTEVVCEQITKDLSKIVSS